MKSCPFCEIVSLQRPASVVYENEVSVAFLDRRPLFPGHVLVVPREHLETLSDTPVSDLGPLLETVQLVSRAVEAVLEAQGSFIAINNRVSQSVPHLHVHVVPRRRKDGLRGFFWPRNPYRSDEHREEVAARLREFLRK